MEGDGVKDYLRDIGRDVASSLGEELKGVAKDKATSFVKEQFGLGFRDELKSAGREILSAVGSELKGAAKDKATAMIKEQLGLGVVDDLKRAGRRLRGKPTDAEVQERLRGIAGTLGQPLQSVDPWKGARTAGTKMLFEQLGMDGGAIAKPCSISVTQLRKAVTAARKANHITGKANREQLMEIGEGHADLGGRHAAAVVKYLERSPLTVPMLREMRGLIKGAFHRPVSELSMSGLQEYIYWTAKDLGWTWSQLDGIAPKRRQPRGCRGSAAPGRSRDAPVRKKRAPSAYNLHVKRYMEEHRGESDVRQLFTDAVAAWKAGGTRRAAGRKAVQTRQYRKSERQRMAAVRADVAAERAAAAKVRSDENQARLRREAPHLARGAPKIPRQRGRGAAYDSGSDDE